MFVRTNENDEEARVERDEDGCKRRMDVEFWEVVVVVVHSVGGAEEEFERRKDLSQLGAVGCISCESLRLAVEKILTACDLKGWGLMRLVPTFKRGGEAAE